MARRLTIINQRRAVEHADPESKISRMRDPDRNPFAKVDAQRDRREDREQVLPGAPAAQPQRRAVVKKKKKIKKAA